jgi:HPr kinase/phosphorylase
VIGNSEFSYINSLSATARARCLDALLGRGANLFVFTAGHALLPKEAAYCEKHGAIVLSTSLSTDVFTHHATFLLAHLGAPRTSLYGTMVEVFGLGVLFEGDPGLGKSETALGLVKRGAALVADDLTCIRKDVAGNILYGSASDSTAGFMEIRGIGIMHVPSVFGINAVRGEKRLQLVVTFKRLKDIRGEVDRIGQTRRMRTILGVDVANIIIPVSEGRDLVNLVETAAQQQKLIMSGYDPVGELSERLRRRADEMEALKKRKG